MSFNLNLKYSQILILSFIIAINGDTTTTSQSNPATTTASAFSTSSTSAAKLITTTGSSLTTTGSSKYSSCNLNKASQREKALLDELTPVMNKQFTWEDSEHRYYFGVCTKADIARNIDEGLIQINKVSNRTFVLGKLNDVDLEGSKSWIRLTYKDGEEYANSCSKNERKAVVYILCNSDNSSEIFHMIEENNQRETDCAYIFELLTPKLCNENNTKCSQSNSSSSSSSSSKFGFFSIAIIVVIGSLFTYFLIGTLYLRFVRQARGLEQIPNWKFWHAIGNKTADCCNFVCRCGQKPTEIRSYENINDNLSDDDNLLNM